MIAKALISTLILATCSTASAASSTWKSEWVYYGKDGKLVYKEDKQGNRIPDFGGVGYNHGRTPPTVPVVLTLSPTPGDNHQRIQDALEKVAARPLQKNGFRGTLLLKKGRYEISKTILINKSGVVLRGEGDSEKGTVLFLTKKESSIGVQIRGGRPPREIKNSRVRIDNSYVPVGSKRLLLESVDGLKVGDLISVIRPGTEQWIHDLKMDQIPPRKDGGKITQWSAKKYTTRVERSIVKIQGHFIDLDHPVVMEISNRYGGGFVGKLDKDTRIRHCGLENLMLKSTFDPSVKSKYKNKEYFSDQNHGSTAVSVKSAADCWVRNITAKHFGYSAVSLGSGSKYISVLDSNFIEPVSVITGGRRYAFEINTQLCLVSGCWADQARHSFVSPPRASGPNVFTHCRATHVFSDIGPHQRWSMGYLYDCIQSPDGAINVGDRGSMGSGHGWAGVNHVFWNCQARGFRVQSPWVTGKNYVIACQGKKLPPYFSKDSPPAIWEDATKKPLEIESLYEAQQKEWLNHSTTQPAHDH